MRPYVLGANLPETFYAGSGRLAAFRRASLPQRPEDWIASTIRRYGGGDSGLSILPDGTRLLDAITADPQAWLGRADPDPGLLVKLIDTGQRLPVHVHPDRDFARSHLGSRYGKTEAWIILDATQDASVHLGFTRDVAADELLAWVRDQDVAALLAATHQLPVRAGDAVLCPAGTPHAIGAGVLLVEVQEPTDFSIMLEFAGFPLAPEDALLGLPLETAICCVHRSAAPPETLRRWRTPTAGSLLPEDAAPFFRARELRNGDTVTGYAVLVIVEGTGTLTGDWGRLDAREGMTLVLPFACGESQVGGSLRAVACQPSAVDRDR